MPKHKKLLILFTILMILALAIPAWAAPTVTLDGQQMSFTTTPVIDNGTTLVPLRAIFEAMGATVNWDQSTQTATAIKNNTTVVLKIGSTTPTINGKVQNLQVPAKIINGSTLAPLRFVGEAFGGSVAWNQASQAITILSKPASGTPPPVSTSSQVKVHYIDVGQADSIYIQLPDHNDILIDGGNTEDGSAVVSYLKKQGVDDLELLIATHPDEDHIGGLPAVLNAFAVEKVLDNGGKKDTKTYNNYMAAAKAEGCPIEEDNYQAFSWGNTKLEVLTGTQTWNDANNYSIVTRLDDGDVHFIFDGDAEEPAEAAIKQGDISAQILKVGHHGSDTSTSPGFLTRVKPQVAVISVGVDNKYGHPSTATIAKLQAAGAKVYRTDQSGNIVVSTDGKTYSVSTAKGGVSPAVTTPASQTPTQSITQPAQQDTQSNTVYVTKTGKKYHQAGCKSLSSSAIPINLEDAKKQGYEPCSICNP